MEATLHHRTLPGAAAPPPSGARLAVAALFFYNGALFASWASRIPAVQSAHGLSHGALGLALLAIGLGAVVAMPVAGVLIARMGSRKVCWISAVLLALFLIAAVLAPNQGLLIAALVCFGANHGAIDVAMNAQAVAVERAYRRPIMSSFHALWSIGGLAGAAFGGLLASSGVGFVAHIATVALVMMLLVLIAFPYLLDVQKQETGDSGESPRPPSWGFRLPTGVLFALGAIAFCIMMGEGAMADWIAVFLRRSIGAAEGVAAAGYATFSITMALGRMCGDALTSRWGPVRIVRYGAVLAACGLGVALVGGTTLLALAGVACVGAGYAIIVPLVFSAAGRANHGSPGVAIASVTTLGYLGFLVGPPLIGFAADLLGLRGALGLVVCASLAVSFLAPSLDRPAA